MPTKIYIRDLDPPSKLRCVLARMGIETLDGLASKTKKQFAATYGVGPLAVEQAEILLKNNHRQFKRPKKPKPSMFTQKITKPKFKWR